MALAGIVGFSIVLRLINFVGPVRGDDFRYLALAYDSLFGKIDTSLTPGADRFGIIAPISILFRIFGPSRWSAVALPFLASIATVVLIYFIGKKLKSREAGLVAALIWAAMPLDVLYSTQVLPDSIVTAYVAGLTLMLLLGVDTHGWKRAAFWSSSLILSVLAFNTKELSAIVTVFSVSVMVFIELSARKEKIVELVQTSALIRWGLCAFGLLGIILLIGFQSQIIVFPDGDMLSALAQNSSDFTNLFLLGYSPTNFESLIPQRVELLDLLVIFFFVTLSVQLIRGDRRVLFPATWAFFCFLGFEWGSEDVTLPITYSTPDAALSADRRHILFFLLPFTLVIAMYLSPALGTAKWRKVIGISALLIGISWLVNETGFFAQASNILLRFKYIAVFIACLLPLYEFRENLPRSWKAFPSFALAILLIGLMLPVDRYHALNFSEEKAHMENLAEAANFLKGTSQEFPIITIPGNDLQLNYASDFELGVNIGSIDLVHPDARIWVQIPDDFEGSGYYVAFENPTNPNYSDLIEPSWIMSAEFGEVGQSRVVIFFAEAQK